MGYSGKTQAYFDRELITTVKSFTVKAHAVFRKLKKKRNYFFEFFLSISKYEKVTNVKLNYGRAGTFPEWKEGQFKNDFVRFRQN
jgi:hypothetical protein